MINHDFRRKKVREDDGTLIVDDVLDDIHDMCLGEKWVTEQEIIEKLKDSYTEQDIESIIHDELKHLEDSNDIDVQTEKK